MLILLVSNIETKLRLKIIILWEKERWKESLELMFNLYNQLKYKLNGEEFLDYYLARMSTELQLEQTKLRNTIKELLRKENKKEGEYWFVLSTYWFKKWKDIIQFDASDAVLPRTDKISPIDNICLFIDIQKNELKPKLQENVDFIAIPKSVWLLLHSRYSGGPEISRPIINNGNEKILEIYPLLVHFLFKSSNFSMNFSKNENFSTFYNEISKRIQKKKFKLFLYENERRGNEIISSPQEKLIKIFQSSSPLFILILEDENEPIISQSNSENNNNKNNNQLINHKNNFEKLLKLNNNLNFNNINNITNNIRVKGVCGLHNLGNSCYMNSALQCLSNCFELNHFFLSKEFEKDINKTNVLGSKGELASSFHLLLNDIWQNPPPPHPLFPRLFKVLFIYYIYFSYLYLFIYLLLLLLLLLFIFNNFNYLFLLKIIFLILLIINNNINKYLKIKKIKINN